MRNDFCLKAMKMWEHFLILQKIYYGYPKLIDILPELTLHFGLLSRPLASGSSSSAIVPGCQLLFESSDFGLAKLDEGKEVKSALSNAK
ncbi:hypothetical protein CCACVL1_07314 [Corchorus capsularis]|uniref:Uncharacterized protein n=1 Tax=Corchorus capsularis TaxID=210143 RepID=A0A1R3J7B3_COCAP|nr:hypothetical protein CCACVL1_07314 [Corchorus capsularis]